MIEESFVSILFSMTVRCIEIIYKNYRTAYIFYAIYVYLAICFNIDIMNKYYII